ncbi:hypothetical protein [Motilibacter deserti]|uniref:CopG family transcriptional regulator n=1 Tax=Motilibacter deserti TaxID=2714956 RepID=A0ABX0GWY9_9ACTN|nr:hypothetical protein [Motilibacter deserti]NHC14616.1 hypothetical protein [Motilibacter deserti]
MTAPRPRPAYERRADGSPRPAPARLASFAAALPPARDTLGDRPSAEADAGTAHRPTRKGEEVVELRVKMPREVRKALRIRAEAAGYTAEDAAYHLVRSWLQQ